MRGNVKYFTFVLSIIYKKDKTMNTKDRIKAAIKKAGYNLRQVSVKEGRATYDSTFDLTIRDASVKYAVIEAIAKKEKSVSYCEVSQEILSGGNTWVDVCIAPNVAESWADKYEWMLKEVLPTMSETNNTVRIGRFRLTYYDYQTVRIFDNEKESWFNLRYFTNSHRSIALDMFLAEQN